MTSMPEVEAPAALARVRPIVTRTARFDIAATDEAGVVDVLLHRRAPLEPGRPHLVVTPNMNHLAELQTSAVLGVAYAQSSMALADGWPVVRLARRLGVDIGERATGSGIVTLLAQTPGGRRRIFLIGGTTRASSDAAAAAFRAAGWVVAVEPAPLGWLERPENLQALATALTSFAPDIVLVGLGSPKQELLALRLMAADTSAVFLGVGASIDFLAGVTRRAPRWMRRHGLEWLHRMLTDPGRLLGRYVGDLLPFLVVVRQSLGRPAALGARSPR
jgi:N-acetylglucosaminyldiphosphoundecaprenol N-acetyl-beta-D-mannosaminyltransferase